MFSTITDITQLHVYNFILYDTISAGAQVAQIHAFDDENDTIIYGLDDIGKQILTVGILDGILKLKVKLDREVRIFSSRTQWP